MGVEEAWDQTNKKIIITCKVITATFLGKLYEESIPEKVSLWEFAQLSPSCRLII